MHDEEIAFPVSPMESLFVELHQDFLAAVNAGFSESQSFVLIQELFRSRLSMVAMDHAQYGEEDY